jgi:hypothetical protein
MAALFRISHPRGLVRTSAFQGSVDTAEGRFAAGLAFDFGGNGDAVGFVAESDQGEKNEEFQLTQIRGAAHFFKYSE